MKQLKNKDEYIKKFHKVDPCGLEQMENVHVKKKMAEKYENLVLYQLEIVGPTNNSDFIIGRQVKY